MWYVAAEKSCMENTWSLQIIDVIASSQTETVDLLCAEGRLQSVDWSFSSFRSGYSFLLPLPKLAGHCEGGVDDEMVTCAPTDVGDQIGTDIRFRKLSFASD